MSCTCGVRTVVSQGGQSARLAGPGRSRKAELVQAPNRGLHIVVALLQRGGYLLWRARRCVSTPGPGKGGNKRSNARAWSSMAGYLARRWATHESKFAGRRGSVYRRLGATNRCASGELDKSPGYRRLRVFSSGLGASANIAPARRQRAQPLRGAASQWAFHVSKAAKPG